VARKPADQTVQRADILLAAATVFQERGYRGATMSDIAGSVGLTAGSLYHHFPAGKRDLLLAVLNDGLDIVLKEVDDIIAAGLSPEETLRRLIEVHVVGVTENTSVGAAMVFEITTILDLNEDESGRDAFLQRRDEYERRYRKVIDNGIGTGAFRSVDVGLFTKTLLGANNWVIIWYRPNGRLSGKEIASHIADTFLAALKC
jgi:TetR/AcrR family transcriptional regulator, cholesterol catabolism regulator